ncbi:cytochrome C oxidase subunit IV family protein [Virgibacillus siamensis]|uniref:cytochrome C oxidase subunit IV family protein n=1 Tax=Virgibacillus siamensis TaxID=480071 RepID=UPI0009840F72|nr:cytochrome C oxidase subunit IV family protein [Virgibacillus siamensis]
MDKKHSGKIPVKHIIGFALSLILTIAAAWVALDSGLSDGWIIAGTLTMAVIQAAIQLFLFMHLTETEGVGHGPWNMMFHASIMVGIVVAGSLFTMIWAFDMGDMDMDSQHQNMQQEQMDHEMDDM